MRGALNPSGNARGTHFFDLPRRCRQLNLRAGGTEQRIPEATRTQSSGWKTTEILGK